MKTILIWLYVTLICAPLLAADEPKLPTQSSQKPVSSNVTSATVVAPGATIRLEFPELSNNLAKVMTGEDIPNVLVADLPANYIPDPGSNQKFPLVIYIDGGTGGNFLSSKRLREVFGPNDYICVRLPLFKKEQTRKEIVGIHAIKPQDYEIISKNYRVMLQKLFDTEPNITSQGSTIGGFSNGAHTTGILLVAKDSFILQHFTHFYMVEGGIGQFRDEALKNLDLKSKRFLLLLGDGGRPNPFEGRAKGIVDTAKETGLNLVALPMKGYGHEFPLDYYKLMAAWAKGEALPDVPPKPAPPATTPAETPQVPATN